MTRDQIRRTLYDIIGDIEPCALDDSGLYIPSSEIEKAVDRIMNLWDNGFVYELT